MKTLTNLSLHLLERTPNNLIQQNDYKASRNRGFGVFNNFYFFTVVVRALQIVVKALVKK